MNQQFSHIPVVWLKTMFSNPSTPAGAYRGLSKIRLFLVILLTCFLAIYYVQSYNVPTRNINIELFDSWADSIIVSHFEYMYPYIGGKDTVCLDMNYITSLKESNPQYILAKAQLNLYYQLENILGLDSVDFRSPYGYMVGSQILADSNSIHNRIVNIRNDSIIIADNLKERFGDNISFVEDLEYNEELIPLEEYSDVFGSRVVQDIPHRIFPAFFSKTNCSITTASPKKLYNVNQVTINKWEITSSAVSFFPYYATSALAPASTSIKTVSHINPLLASEDCSQSNFFFSFSALEKKALSIDTLVIRFDKTVQFSRMFPEPSEIGVNCIKFYGREKTAKIINRGLQFHTINPEMANKMLIKMFVLTAIITALLAESIRLSKRLFKGKQYRLYRNNQKAFLIISAVIALALIVMIVITQIR